MIWMLNDALRGQCYGEEDKHIVEATPSVCYLNRNTHLTTLPSYGRDAVETFLVPRSDVGEDRHARAAAAPFTAPYLISKVQPCRRIVALQDFLPMTEDFHTYGRERCWRAEACFSSCS